MRKLSVLSLVALLLFAFTLSAATPNTNTTTTIQPTKVSTLNPTVDAAPPTPVDPPPLECEEYPVDDNTIGLLCLYPDPWLPGSGPFPGF
jgi:hypothetical protein